MLDLEKMGLVEMSSAEQEEVDGGFLLFLAAALILIGIVVVTIGIIERNL